MKLTHIPLSRMDPSLKKFAVMTAVIGIALTQLGDNSPFQGQLGPQDVFIPTHFIGGDTVVTLQGHPVTNYHNSVVCSSTQGSVDISQDGDSERLIMFWVYEYTRNEQIDERTGRMDMSTADGKFYFSRAVLADHPELRGRHTLETYTEGKLYYVMSNADLQYSCNRGISASAVCGNGLVEAGEQCDDNDTEDNDGCSNQCTIDTGFSCTGEPSVCNFLTPILPTAGPGPGGPGPGPNDDDGPGPGPGPGGPDPDSVQLHRIRIEGEEVVVDYSKNFETCAHIWKRNGPFDQKINFICRTGNNLTARALLSSLDESFVKDQEVKLCHGNNGNLCSEYKTVENVGESEEDSVQLHRIRIEGEEVVVDYSKNFETCAHIWKRNGRFDQRINFICRTGDNLTARALLSSLRESFEKDQEVKLCHGNNGNLCSEYKTVENVGGGSNDAHAYITMKSFGATDTAVENQKDITLVRFEARAEGADLLLTKTMFEAMGAGSSLDIHNYAIWVDSDGDKLVDHLLQDGGSSNGSNVTLDNMRGGGYVLGKDRRTIFELHGDVQSSLSGDQIQMRFEIGLEGYIGIETLDPDNGGKLVGIITDNARCRGGDETGCDITVTTTDSVRWNLAKQGDLFITQDTTPIRNRQLLGGTLSEAIFRLTFHAEKEDIDVTDLRFTAVDNVRSIDRLELFFSGESAPFAIATLGGCGNEPGDFCTNTENEQMLILKGTDKDVIVRARMRSDEQGGVSGEVFSIGITARNSVVARGVSSSNDLVLSNNNRIAEGEIFVGQETPTDNDGNIGSIWGKDHVSVHSKIIAITNANPDANGTFVPTGISAIGQFKFTAAAHNNSKNGDNDVIIESILWTVNATNVAIAADSFALYNKADQTKKVSCRPLTIYGNLIEGVASGTLLVECTGLYASVLNSEIDGGTGTTLVLQASATSRGGVSVLQVSLQQFNRIGRKYGYGSENSHIQWIDRDARTFRIFEWIEYPETVIKSTSYNS